MSQTPLSTTTSEPVTLKRRFRFRDAFTLAFVFISPIVALYAVFGLIVTAAGPAGWWVFPIGLALQMLIALSLGVLVSRWPYQGGSYQWARRLFGENYGWATGWAYIWTIIIVFASGGFAIANFIPAVLNIPPFPLPVQVLVAVIVLLAVTGLNLLGPTVLKVLGRMSLGAEVLGSVVLATVLLIWHRHNDISIIFSTAGASPGNYVFGGFLVAVGFVGFGLAGFESVCSMAGEIESPRTNLPKAIVLALLGIGVVVMYSALALVLAVPNFPAVVAGQIADPAASTVADALGGGVAQVFFLLVIIGFAAAMTMAQTTISRVIWSFSVDGVLPGARYLGKLSPRYGTPNRVIVLAGVLAVLVTLFAFSEKIYATLISAATASFFVTMGLVVVGLLIKLVTRKWSFGPFSLGVLTIPVVIGASIWIVLELFNLVAPRDAPGQAWYVTYAVLIGLLAIAVVGVIVRMFVRGSIRSANQELELEEADLIS